MAEGIVLKVIDRLIKPQEWYQYNDLKVEGFCFIGTKNDQKNAGFIQNKEESGERKRSFGYNPIQPYRDYYGKFKLKTRIIPKEIEVLFAIGYTYNKKIVTVDDYSNFSWLRLATDLNDFFYPNLAHQKQLLDYFLKNSKTPEFIIFRIYHYLEFELLQHLITEITQREATIQRR